MKTCKVCKVKFEPTKPLQLVCGFSCALDYSFVQKQKAVKKEAKERKEKLKSRSDYLKDAQTAFNAWVRARDAKEPCISCQRHHDGQYHAGHYRTVGACPELRFEPENVHKQCSPCNLHKHGNIVEYRLNLVKKIGLERLEWLEGIHAAKKYTIDDLKAITKEYREKLKQLQT